ncbi:MAG: 4Fe-4S binding protein [Dehalococcoidia bacterium]|nr:4Fe-4S binding protein [Dehalococcoidia bacterium]
MDNRTCNDPLSCRVCLDRCPERVFGAYPRGRRERGTAARDWMVFAIFPSECTGCMQCVTLCPRRAITVR